MRCPASFSALPFFEFMFVHTFSTDTAPKSPSSHPASSAAHDAPSSDTHAVVGIKGAAYADVYSYGFCGAVEWDAGARWSEDDG